MIGDVFRCQNNWLVLGPPAYNDWNAS